MTRSLRTVFFLAISSSRWRRRLLPGLLTLVLAFPGTAHPYTLEQLLRLPLEQLLQLEISPRRVSQAPGDSALTLASGQPVGSRHAA
jgi:hypothetical protein